MRPCFVGAVWGGQSLLAWGFLNVQDRKLLLRKSFVSKVITSVWAQRQALHASHHLLPFPTRAARGGPSTDPGDLPPTPMLQIWGGDSR